MCPTGCVSMDRGHLSVVMAEQTGNLHCASLQYDEEAEMYNLGEKSLLLTLPSATKVSFDRTSNTRVAVLGKERPPLLVDIVEGKVCWEGRNVPADELQLKIPMSDNDCSFSEDGNILTVCTAYGKMRVYDFRLNKRRPIRDVQVDRHPLLSLRPTPAGDILLGSNVGEVFRMESRKEYQLLRKYNEAHGAVTSLSVSEGGNLFCSGRPFLSSFSG